MPDSTRHDHGRAVWTALFVTVLWSSSWVLIRIVLDDEDLAPVTFAGLRYTLAALVLLGWTTSRPAHRRQLASLDRSVVKRLVVLGVVFFGVTQGAQFVAIDSQPAATASLMLSLTAFAVAVFSVRSLGERSSARQFLGAALVAVGAIVYFSGDLGATAVGLIASLVGLAANVAGSILGRSVNRDHALHPVIVTTVSMGTGALVLLVTGLVIEGRPTVTITAGVIIGWLAVVNTAVAFTLWNKSLRHLSAVESAAINNTMLVQIAALGWIFLNEPPGALGVIGILVVSLGVFLTQPTTSRRSRHEPVPAPQDSDPAKPPIR